ncbi:uncharacterized protein V6R79_026071 [Siganus canaliculatus]
MENQSSAVYLTLGGHVEVDRFRYVYFVLMFTVYILILCSNSTIVYLICVHPNLHEPMYVFIAALLVNSVLFSSAIYPKLLLDFLSDRQIISYPACLLQFHVFYSLGGSEFLLLLAMAYDRYVSICRPLQYAVVMRSSRVNMMLSFAWLLPQAQIAMVVVLNAQRQLCGFTFNGIFCNNSFYQLYCESQSVENILDMFIFLNVVLLPLVFIVFTYTRILIISFDRSREVRRKAARTCLPHLIVLMNLSSLVAFDVIMIRLDSKLPKTVQMIMTLQIIIYHTLFNPVIYGLKMTEIFKHLKALFCLRK